MKKLHSLFAISFIVLGLISCSNGDDPISGGNGDPSGSTDKVTPSVTFATPNQTISSDGGNVSITFNSSGKWTATTNVDWININTINGNSGSNTITVTVKENSTYDERDCLLVVTTENVSKSITITKKQLDALLVTSNSILIDENGGNPTIEVKANIDYSCKVDEKSQDWISVVSTRALTTSSITLDIDANTSSTDRQGYVTISSGDKAETITIYQKAKTGSSSTTDLKGTAWWLQGSSNTNYIITFKNDGTFILTAGIYLIDNSRYWGNYTYEKDGIYKLDVYYSANASGSKGSHLEDPWFAGIINGVLYIWNKDYTKNSNLIYVFLKID